MWPVHEPDLGRSAEGALTVTALNRLVKAHLAREAMFRDVWVRGEISNFKHHPRGHMYFSLKDETSRLQAVMFASANRVLRFRPEDGLRVIARGDVDVFERDGVYQLYVKEMQPDGIGSLYLAFEQLKEKLRREGLFDRKRPIPRFPKRVAVITSTSGAAIRDILTTLGRRFPAANVVIIPAQVQGLEAPASLVAALGRLRSLVPPPDVAIVARGGGSIEELWAFNDEAVARAIFASPVPVISGVGHETDTTIADFVADLRAPTPTGAAERAVPDRRELRKLLAELRRRMEGRLVDRVRRSRERLQAVLDRAIWQAPERLIRPHEERLDRATERLVGAMERTLERRRARLEAVRGRLGDVRRLEAEVVRARRRFDEARRRLGRAMLEALRRHRIALAQWAARLEAAGPLAPLRRGYALVEGPDGRLVKRVASLAPGEGLRLRFEDGVAIVTVWDIREEAWSWETRSERRPADGRRKG
ncbi:MAG: exodeoxyribonuclease VII large subunit [Hydrogenibacillus schlegelii]|nr:exodeoxyribonuclease VII large subunit [Hydrogenibacillus schlegelii]